MGNPIQVSSVPAQTPYIQYVATSGQTAFDYPFEITEDSDLVVLVNSVEQGLDTGYSLSGQGNSTGGTLTFTTGQTAGTIITLYRDITIERISQLTQNGGFFSAAFNAEYNRIYMILQQLQESIGFCLQIPFSNVPSGAGVTLTPALYANKYLAFDANGNPEPALLTSSGTLTQSIILSLLTQTGIGSVFYPITAQETTAGITPSNYGYAPGNVLRYGADPTGTNDSTTAIQEALNSVSYFGSSGPTSLNQALQQGGEVYFPRGFYKFSSTLYINANVHLVGEDCGQVDETNYHTSGATAQCVNLYYTGSASTAAIDCTGFWLVAQTAYSGTATAGSANSITIATGLTIGSAAYLTITGGTGSGQTRTISYVPETGVATPGWNWDTAPDNTSTYSIGAVAVGSRLSQTIPPGENALLTDGLGTYSNGQAIKNINLIASNGQRVGIRQVVATRSVISNVFIQGFNTSLEADACSYCIYENIVSQAIQVGFAWVQGDHLTRINCADFGVATSASPMSSTNRPWFVDYAANEALDSTPNYGCGHYFINDAAGTLITCDGEGFDRSYWAEEPLGTTFIGCHMERWNQYGAYLQNGTFAWLGGDVFSTTSGKPAFQGITVFGDISGVQVDGPGNAAALIGSFPNTYGGRVNVRACSPTPYDSAPAAGSLVVWDAYAQPGTGNANALTETAITTAGNGTLTAAAIASGVVVRTGPSGAFTDTTDTAANIIGQFIPGAVVGSAFKFRYFNNSSYTATIAAGSGVSLYLLSASTVATVTSREFIAVVTGIGESAAVTLYG